MQVGRRKDPLDGTPPILAAEDVQALPAPQPARVSGRNRLLVKPWHGPIPPPRRSPPRTLADLMPPLVIGIAPSRPASAAAVQPRSVDPRTGFSGVAEWARRADRAESSASHDGPRTFAGPHMETRFISLPRPYVAAARSPTPVPLGTCSAVTYSIPSPLTGLQIQPQLQTGRCSSSRQPASFKVRLQLIHRSILPSCGLPATRTSLLP